MIFLFRCNRRKPECCGSYSCGVECTETLDFEYSENSNNPPTSLEDLEARFEYVGEFMYDGTKQTVWEEKERKIEFS